MNTSSELVANVFDAFLADDYAALATNPETYPLLPVLDDVLHRYQVKQEGASVLDLGCGPGILKEYSSFEYYAGVDLSENMLQAAAAKGYNELIQAQIEEYLPLLPDASFDVVICFSVSYFIAQDALEQVIAHINRIAKQFWLITFDAIPENLASYYKKEQGISLYNHTGMQVPVCTERYQIAGWESAVDGTNVPVEVVLNKI